MRVVHSVNPDSPEHFAQFGAWARSVHAENTAEAYEASAKKFRAAIPCASVPREDGTLALSVIPAALRDFAQGMAEAGLSPSSIRLHVSGTVAYLEWLRDSGIHVPELKRPKLPEVREIEIPRLDAHALNAYDAEAAQLREPYATALRLLPLTGLRVSELCELRALELDLAALDPLFSTETGGVDGEWGRAYVIRIPAARSKTGRGRDVTVFPALGTPLLDRYVLQVRPFLPGYHAGREWLFPTSDGTPITAATVQAHVRTIRDRLGIPNLTPHTFRHYVATTLLERGMSTLQVQHHMGHANANTTARYVRNASLASRQREIARIDPSER